MKIIIDALYILKKFGVKDFFTRTMDLIKVKLYDCRKNIIYNKKIKSESKNRVEKNILGNKMLLNLNDYGIHRDLYLDGYREPVATDKIKSILTKNDIVLEVGANIGYYALIEAKICKKVYAVEPVPENVSFLKKNISLNKLRNVEVYQLAFGDKAGYQHMALSDKSNWHSFYKKNSNNNNKIIKVKVVTVDDFLDDKKYPSLIKMDVEGYELHVIKGMKKALKKVKWVFLELHSSIMPEEEVKELLDTMDKNGYKIDLIVKYDRPGLSKILNNEDLRKIYRGYKGVYEMFFKKIN